MPVELRIVFCNLAYSELWYTNLRRQNARHLVVLDAILRQIKQQEGKDISKADVISDLLEQDPQYPGMGFDPIPSRGQTFAHNGSGIRHAKFSASKNVAVIWERIGDIVYVTFDDHAPIRYHRAIYYLRQLRLGRDPKPRYARNRRWFVEKLHRYWRKGGKYRIKGVRPADRYYE